MIQFVKKEGEKFNEANNAMAENSYVVNNVMHSIFKTVTVELNGQVFSSLPLYHYKAYFENLLNVDKNCTEKVKSEGWYLDTADKFEDISDANLGAKFRRISSVYQKMFSNENVNEHNVTLFSNEDTDRFNNTLSEFTNTLTPPLVLKPLGKWRVGMSDVTHSHNLKRAFKGVDDTIQFPTFLANKMVKFYTVPHFGAIFTKAPFIYTDSYFHQFLNFRDGFQEFKLPKPKKGEKKAEEFLLNLEMNEEDLRKISRSADIEQGGESGGRGKRSVQIQNTNQGGW